MVVDLLDAQTLWRLLMLAILVIMAAAVGYAKGHREGSREGYTRGRAVSRHSSGKAVN